MKKKRLCLVFAILLLFSLTLVSADEFGYDNPTLPKLTNPNVFSGNFSWNGNCLDGGVEIKSEGIICGQKLEVFNITSVNVTKQNVTVLENLIAMKNIIAPNFIGFHVGNSSIWSRAGANTFLTNIGDKVGIGTASPYSGLHYQGDIFYLTPNAGTDSNDNITIKNYATGNGAPDIILRTADISGAYGIGVGTLYLIGGSKTTHYGGIGGGGGKISLQGGRGRDASHDPSSYAPILLQSNGGNVGIGTTSPDRLFEIFGSASVFRFRDSGATASATTAFIEFGGTDGGNWNRTGYIGDGSSGNTDLYFQAEEGNLRLGDSSGHSVLTLSGGDATFTGKVGIGTITPQNKLNVVGDLNVTGTVFADAINISNSSFSFTHDNNNSIRYSIENQNSGSNATALITILNDVGGLFGIGIGSSNYLLGSILKPNITALFSRSQGEIIFANFYNQAFVWMINPSDDNDVNNLVEIMRLNENGLNVTGNVTSENLFIPQYVYSHNNATMVLASANVWANLTFNQEEAEIKKGISHVHNDNTNHTFTINEDGIYDINYNFDVIDTSASSTDIDVAGRIIYFNGTEIIGSVFETDITKKNIETELTHSLLATLRSGDKIIFQFTATDVDVEISTHGTFGDHPESATIEIKKVANL